MVSSVVRFSEHPTTVGIMIPIVHIASHHMKNLQRSINTVPEKSDIRKVAKRTLHVYSC